MSCVIEYQLYPGCMLCELRVESYVNLTRELRYVVQECYVCCTRELLCVLYQSGVLYQRVCTPDVHLGIPIVNFYFRLIQEPT